MICPKCKGAGEVRSKVDYLCGLFTLGLTALMDLSTFEECSICEGCGHIKE